VAQPTTTGWWVLLLIALFVIGVWPPDRDKSLAVKFVNWTVDPRGRLPILPPQLGFGTGDDLEAVEAHDAQARSYDRLYNLGGWTRTRLRLKVAGDPFNPSTERQLLLVLGAVTAFLVWRFGTKSVRP
jgi:hypothetical protein